jgi:hypothetical protein
MGFCYLRGIKHLKEIFVMKRQRIDAGFNPDRLKYRDIRQYLADNAIAGTVARWGIRPRLYKDPGRHYVNRYVDRSPGNSLTYSHSVLFRDNKERPEELFIRVSMPGRIIISAWTSKGRTWSRIQDMFDWCRRSSDRSHNRNSR